MDQQVGTCLITGAAGFIGSHLAERLIRDGYHVIGVDCFADFYPRAMKERNLENLRREERFTFVEADLLQLDLVALLKNGLAVNNRPQPDQESQGPTVAAGGVDYVFHLAAQAGVRTSWGASFEVYTRNNVLATQQLLEAAKQAPLKQLVYASSSSVYGDAETYPTTEDMTPRPASPYGVTKLAGEHLCRLYSRNYGVPVACLRFFTVYGPRQRPDMAFHRFIRAVLEGREIVIFGDGEQTRDFTYVGDTVDGIVRAAVTPLDYEDQVLNIGGSHSVSVNQVLRIIKDVMGLDMKVRHTAQEKGDVRHTAASITRAQVILGYNPAVPITEGLAWEASWLTKQGPSC